MYTQSCMITIFYIDQLERKRIKKATGIGKFTHFYYLDIEIKDLKCQIRTM